LNLDSIRLDSLPADAILDPGELATMDKKPRCTQPVTCPSSFGEVMYLDIIFGPEISVGNVHYGLLFTDCYSRMTYLYLLHNLTSDIPKQMEAFFAHIGIIPQRLISEFDMKVIAGKAREYLKCLLVHVNAAPLYH
jgi:hypothetical protein